jgi:YHS domain-containing protein
MKPFLVTSALFILLGCTVHAQQAEIFSPAGKAIRGYDPVAFFREGKPVMGADSLTYTWRGAQWNFANRSNLDSFTLHPDRYAPQYGGYCAYGTAQGHKAATQVDTWSIVDGKLYFNYNQKVKTGWDKDRKALIEKADLQWPAVKDHP